MIVDVHAHIVPPEILGDAASPETWRPRLVDDPASRGSGLELAGRRLESVVHEIVDADRIVSTLAGFGVDYAILSPFVSLLRYAAPADQCLASSQAQNDGIAAVAHQRPNRVAGLGTVPMQDVPLAIRELERLMKLGLRGVEVGANVNGVYLGDCQFRPFWEACQGLGALVFIHPLGMPNLRDYYMTNLVGNPMDTAIAAAHLVLSGTMEAYPALRVLLSHGGGVLPSLRGRLDHGFAVRPEVKGKLPRPPSDDLRRFYYDTITHDATLLRELVDFAGPERVLLGSDYPFDMGTDDPVGEVRAAKLSAGAEASVLGGNAVALFRLPG